MLTISILVIALFVIGIAAIIPSEEAQIDTRTFLFRVFVVFTLMLLVVLVTLMVTLMVPQ